MEWAGRSYKREDWTEADPVNRALSAANSCLYGICHAAIVSAGYSPGLGFIHTGKQLSFVYDIADLYKVDLTIPVAFEIASTESAGLERAVRVRLRDAFKEKKLLSTIISDIHKVLNISDQEDYPETDYDGDAAMPGPLWDGPITTG